MNSIAKQAHAKKLPIYVLSWHVDYWNNLKTDHGAWVDPYSSAKATKRQTRYTKAVPGKGRFAGRRYTPQIMVDGRHPYQLGQKNPFAALKKQIGLKRPSSIKVKRTADGIEWVCTNVPDGCELLVALVQRGITQSVGAGENKGRTLHHENVVRWHTTVDLKKELMTSKVKMKLPEGLPTKSLDVIVAVQDKKSMAVHAADAVQWDPPQIAKTE